MNLSQVAVIIKWIARIYGGIVLLIPIITLIQASLGIRELHTDWRTLVLISGLIVGLALAYRWELIGGIIALISVFVSGFLHPVIIPPPLLYIIYWIIIKKKEK